MYFFLYFHKVLFGVPYFPIIATTPDQVDLGKAAIMMSKIETSVISNGFEEEEIELDKR